MNSNILSQKLKELRKANGYKQDYVASVLGIVRQTYSHYETGKRSPSPEILYKLAKLYNISVDSLLEMSSTPTTSVELNSYNYNSAEELSKYLDYLNNPTIAKKFQYHTNLEKELLYYFEKISESDKKEIIEFTKIKASKNKCL